MLVYVLQHERFANKLSVEAGSESICIRLDRFDHFRLNFKRFTASEILINPIGRLLKYPNLITSEIFKFEVVQNIQI